MVADKYASVITKIFVWGVLFGHALQAISLSQIHLLYYYRDTSLKDSHAITLQGGRLNRVVGCAGSRTRQTRAVCLSNMKAC